MINKTLITGILLSGIVFLTEESFVAPVGDGSATLYVYSYDGAGNCTARSQTQNLPLQGPPAVERLSRPEMDLNIRVIRSLIRSEQKSRRAELKASRAAGTVREAEIEQIEKEGYETE